MNPHNGNSDFSFNRKNTEILNFKSTEKEEGPVLLTERGKQILAGRKSGGKMTTAAVEFVPKIVSTAAENPAKRSWTLSQMNRDIDAATVSIAKSHTGNMR